MKDRGVAVNFTGGKVVVGPKRSNFNKKQVIGRRGRDLYLLRGKSVKDRIHDSDNQSKIWHRRMGHLH